jgi:hypothetical protein
MEPTELKEYGLRFVIDKNEKLRVRTNVALEAKAPLSPNDFYWIESVQHEPSGFMYKVYGLDTFFHGSELYPLLPVLVSDDVLEHQDKFYHDGVIYECSGLSLDDDLNMWVVSNVDNESFIESDCMKVVATPEMFGWLYNEGPPHDHNMVWQDSRYLEDYIQTCLVDAVKNNLKMTVMVKEMGVQNHMHIPLLHEGKIIIDQYNLLRKSSFVIIF